MEFMEFALELLSDTNPSEIPVAALIVKDDKIISHATNKKEETQDVTSHAEILAIRGAERELGNWRLENCDMYVTLEPCPMCAWAIINSRIRNLYFGSYDCNYGAFGGKIDLRTLANSKLKVYGGICEEKCDKILEKYFKNLRQQKL